MGKKKLPLPTGEYAVGTLTYTVKDDREEVMEPGTMRSVAARVYYPVLKESVEGLSRTVALSDNMIKGFKDSFKVAPNFKKDPEANLSACYADAERIPGKKFPLIMFNPGYDSYREGNSFLCIELASHGYVVICVAHSMELMCTEFDDGTAVFFDKSLSKKMYQPMLGGIMAMYKHKRCASRRRRQAKAGRMRTGRPRPFLREGSPCGQRMLSVKPAGLSQHW